MILSVTVNPMVEHLFDQPGFHAGGAFRPAGRSRVIATGKPLNCTRALRDLGHDVLAVACIGGATGREIEECLEREDLPHRLFPIRGESRRGFTVTHGGHVTTVYGPPPTLRDSEVDALVATVKSLLPARLMILGGSTPRDDVYARLSQLGVPVVLDTRGAALESAMDAGDVFLAKPNLRECRETFGALDLERAVLELQTRGARNVVVTDGPREALFLVGGRRIRLRPPEVEVVHTVGCGDALCAGLIHALDQGPERAAAFAMACGAYAATRPEIARLEISACRRMAEDLL
ncbi:MAG TPA: PfkB family carbohydrate kinase [Myxococcota bacterium]|nr:PfkB family carbohydrate kinase [Myxococcota bacterium]